jgi:lipopolysaccharide heptosyltransferase II
MVRTDAGEVLIRGPNWTGDLVMATPGFRALRAGLPGARLTLAVPRGLEELVAGAPWFDAVLPLDGHRRGLGGLVRDARRLRRRARFDLGLCIPDSWSSALLLRLAGVRRLVGYRRAGRGLLLHAPVTPPREWGRRRMVARERFVLGLIAALGVPERGTQLELFTTPAEEAAALEALAAAGGADPEGGGAPLVALAPGASFGPSKLWPAAYFARVADAVRRAGAQPVLLGSPGERALARAVREAAAGPLVDLVGALTLGSLKAVVRRARLLVCNDAGARHVAVAFGVPCVVLMGPTSLAKTDMNLEAVRVLHQDVACRPCYQRRCPTDHRCMARLSPRRVIDAALEALAAS